VQTATLCVVARELHGRAVVEAGSSRVYQTPVIARMKMIQRSTSSESQRDRKIAFMGLLDNDRVADAELTHELPERSDPFVRLLLLRAQGSDLAADLLGIVTELVATAGPVGHDGADAAQDAPPGAARFVSSSKS
jgi:hypothetical protein